MPRCSNLPLISTVYYILVGCSASMTVAQDVDETKKYSALAHQLATRESKAYQLTVDGSRAQLQKDSLLHWSNPVSGQVFGDVFLWTRDGRPEAIASIYKWFSPRTHLSSEFQSLSESPIRMTDSKGAVVWRPGPGLQMRPLGGAPVPSDRTFQRLRQMKGLAQQFDATATDRSDPTNTWNLRLQSAPIYRYSSESKRITDGALFAFCQGNTNNPEVLLLIEARESEGSGKAYYYGLGRQNSIRFQVRRNDQLIWDVPRLAPPWDNLSKPEKPYIVFKTMSQ